MVNRRCFLCAKKDNSLKNFEEIEFATVPASKKPIKVVLQHLANCIKTKLDFGGNACVCPKCLKELGEYDDLMLKLLTFQKKLTNLLETTLNTPDDLVEEDFDEEPKSTRKAYTIIELTDEDMQMDNDIDVDDDDDRELDDSEDDLTPNEAHIRSIRECVVCGRLFKTKKELADHIIECHDTPPVFTCHICGAIRKDEEYLDLHMNVHEGKTENECRYCDKRYTRPVNTLRHMRLHWNKKKYQCEKCGVCFSQDNLLYNHKLRHDAEENPLICSICNQTFRTKKTYNHHMQIHSENRKRHQCEFCSKSFTERYTLKMHLKTHPLEVSRPETEEAVSALVAATISNEDITDIPCVICGIKFENKDSLNQHLEAEHDVLLN